MLQAIRDKATGWIAWAIVILISIPFALWGIHEYLGPDPEVVVAEVNDREISFHEFNRAHQRQQAQLRSMMGERFDPGLIDEERLRRETLESLIADELVLQASIAKGLRIGDGQLAGAIRRESAFADEERFSQARYEQWLRSQGLTPGAFEADLRRSLLNEQFLTGVAASAVVPDGTVERALRLLDQRRSFSALRIPAERYPAPDPLDEEIARYYEENRAEFVVPERVNLTYVELDRDAIAEEVRVDAEELERLYEGRRAQFEVPEHREARHLLLRVPEGADEAEVRERIGALRERAAAGESLADLAREHSEDPGSAAFGGDLGAVSRGIMDPAFEDAVFALAEGEMSEPIRTPFGWHLIEVTRIEQARSQAFEELREDLIREHRRELADQIFSSRAEDLANLSFEHFQSLDAVADVLGLEIRETGPISREDPPASGIASHRRVREAAFSSEVLLDGNNSEPIEIDGTRMVVVRLLERIPPTQLSLDEARDDIRERLRAQAARRQLADVGDALVRRLREGEAPDVVVADLSLEWVEHREVGRTRFDLDRDFVETVFRMPRPDTAPIYDGLIDGEGRYVVVALHEVQDGRAEPETGQPARVREALEADLGRGEFDAVLRALRASANVTLRLEEAGRL